jgi:hypothetical protein
MLLWGSGWDSVNCVDGADGADGDWFQSPPSVWLRKDNQALII